MAQPVAAQALLVGVVGVEGGHGRDQARAERPPVILADREGRSLAVEQDRLQGGDDLFGRGRGQHSVAREGRQVPDEWRRAQQALQGHKRIGDCQRGPLGPALGRAPPPGWRAQVDEHAAADRAPGGNVAQNEAIQRRRGDGPV
ncbi:MAG TPA: hypothetical protein VHY34_06300 [Caulobacteraceae bacterium]|nr:hypothetical protein [Caulobacteraceae bacterium]